MTSPAGPATPRPPRPSLAERPDEPGWWRGWDHRWHPPEAAPAHAFPRDLPAPQFPPPQIAASGNTGAGPALVLGILAVLFGSAFGGAVFALLLGVLAISFGVGALSRARQHARPAGTAIAGVVLGIIGVLFAINGFTAQRRFANIISRALTRVTVDANPSVNKMRILHCEQANGTLRAEGTLVNPSAELRSFRFRIGFKGSDGSIQIDARTTVFDVAPGQTVHWSALTSNSLKPSGCVVDTNLAAGP
jgi:hypothetical protein